jgi:hypothetical protein
MSETAREWAARVIAGDRADPDLVAALIKVLDADEDELQAACAAVHDMLWTIAPSEMAADDGD